MKKIVSLKELSRLIPKISGKKIVLVGGCFDLLHYGHLTFLKNAKKAGDFLIVALESDDFIKKNKSRASIHNQNQRAEILASLNAVDLIVKLPLLNSDEEYSGLVKLIKPSVIAVTKGDEQVKNKMRQAKMIGAKVLTVTNLLDLFSSNNILKILNPEP